MKKLKDFFKKVYEVKYYIILFVVFFLIFFTVYFPQDKVLRILFLNITRQTGMNIMPSDPKMNFFPNIGLEFKSAKIKSPDDSVNIDLGETSLGLPITSIITFSPALEVESKSFRGNITAKILGIPLNPKKQPDELYVDIVTKGVLLNEFLKLKTININAIMDLNVQGSLNLVNPSYSDLDIVASMNKIQIKEGNVMGFPIPGISIKTGELAVAVAKSEIIITKMNFGAPSDELNLSVKGKISLKINRPYDLTVKLKIAGNLEQQFGQFLAMLPAQAKNAEGFYNIRIKGDTRSPIPQITPLQ